MIKTLVAFAFVGLNLYIYAFLATDEVVPDRASFETFPMEVGEWRCDGLQEMKPKALKVLGATDYAICNYLRPARRGESLAEDGSGGSSGGGPGGGPRVERMEVVNFYAGFHASQVRKGAGGIGSETSIHPPEHCLPGSGWDIIDARVVGLDLPGLPAGHGLRASGPEAKRFVIAKGKQRQLVYFWYQSRGRVVARSEEKILFQFWDRARNGRTDGSLVRFMTPIIRGDVEAAEARLHSLASGLTPRLAAYLPE